MQGYVYYYCYSQSCIISWERVSVYSSTYRGLCLLSAQVEMFASGAIEIRYGSQSCPYGIVQNFEAGIQDNVQGIAVPMDLSCTTTSGICASSTVVQYPSNVGARFSMFSVC